MKAVVYTQYEPPDVLQLKDVPKPTPKENVTCHKSNSNELVSLILC
jgi:hypothetical protein